MTILTAETPPVTDSLGVLKSKTEVLSLSTVKLSGNKDLSVHIRLSHTVVLMSIYSFYSTPTPKF